MASFLHAGHSKCLESLHILIGHIDFLPSSMQCHFTWNENRCSSGAKVHRIWLPLYTCHVLTSVSIASTIAVSVRCIWMHKHCIMYNIHRLTSACDNPTPSLIRLYLKCSSHSLRCTIRYSFVACIGRLRTFVVHAFSLRATIYVCSMFT